MNGSVSVRRTLLAAISLAIGACVERPGPAGEHPTTMPAALRAALDTCERYPPRAVDSAARRNLAPFASRWSGSIRAFPAFSLFVPDSAHATTDTTNAVHFSWPGCPRCDFSVSVAPDSGITLETRIARMIASQKRIDSINKDPKTEAYEFGEIDGPPRPFITPNGRGYVIDNDCGDCASTTILLARPGYIASISFGADDDTPDFPRSNCEMTAVARTFTWRP